MNLPVLCKVLGDIPLHDVDVGSAVLEVINTCVATDEHPFDFTMTGNQMYIYYKSLSPTSRLALEDLELLTKGEWINLSKQCEMIVARLDYTVQSKDLYLQATYVFGMVLCMLIAGVVIGGYITNLVLRGDTPDSHVLRLIYNLLTFYTEDTQL